MISLPNRVASPVPVAGQAAGIRLAGRIRRHPHWTFVGLAIGVAIGLRAISATGTLWLDEIWSLQLAQQSPSALAVVTDVHTDNNHPLNTLYLRWVGIDRWPIIYRLPAIVSGTLVVLIATRIATRWGRVASVTAATLLASNYLLVHYSSEARGYSLALCAAYGGWCAALQYLELRKMWWACAFWSCCWIGLLSHPIFAHFLLAVACWYPVTAAIRAQQPLAACRPAMNLLFVPILSAGLCYWFLWRNLDLGGGPPYGFGEVLEQTWSLAVGGPALGWGATCGALVAASACVWTCWSLRSDSAQTGLFLLVAWLIPVLHALAIRPPFLFPRYFLMAAAFVPFAVGLMLARLYQVRPWGRWIYACLILIWLGVNLQPTTELATIGRGQYLAALQYLADSTDSSAITVSSDHNYGVRKLIDFFAPQVTTPGVFHYVDGNQWSADGPQWLIRHRTTESSQAPPSAEQVIDGHRFELERVFDCSILSGWQWWCYRRSGRSTESGGASRVPASGEAVGQ